MQREEVWMDGFFLFSSISPHDSSFHPGWGPGVSAGTALCLPLYHTHAHIHTHTYTSNPPELWFCEAPATAHEICLYHLVAVKVLVWTTVAVSDPQPIKLKTWREREDENTGKKSFIFSSCEANFVWFTSHAPCSFKALFCANRLPSVLLLFSLKFSPLHFSSCLLPCGSAPLSSSVGCQFLMIIW